MRFAGLDWASRSHDVTVLDDAGTVLDRWAFPHTEAGWQMALGRLRSHGAPGNLPVIIEKTSGLIVDRLLAAGHPVVPVHPNSFYATRPRWGAITAYAHNARMQSPWAARLYAGVRARGKPNPHATRIVARAWIRVIWACWHTGVPYDPATHQAQQRLAG